MKRKISKVDSNGLRIIFTLFLFLNSPFIIFAHGINEASKNIYLKGTFLDYIYLGAEHMLTGLDHLLFLLGVMFFLNKFSDIVKVITAFTLGHCLTLTGATWLGIQANPFLIDAIIALTVCYKAFDNLEGFKLFLDKKSPNLFLMIFIFGLIHGFGLSTRLQDIVGQGIRNESSFEFFQKVFGFNLGVELGQIVALFIILVFLNIWRKYSSFLTFSRFSNSILMLCGGILFILQIVGYMNTNKSVSDIDNNSLQHQINGHDHQGHNEHHSHENPAHPHHH